MIDRRQFLTAAGAGLAGQGAATKIRTGIIGVQHAHLGPKLQAMRDNPAFDVVAISEADDATRRLHASDASLKPLRWIAVDEMLADKSVDLIVFEGEVRDAVPMGKRILEAGKHLHLEKPPTNKLEPFRELVDLARQRRLKLQLGYLWRFHAGIEAALEAHTKGWLGEVFMIRAMVNADRDGPQRIKEARFAGGTMFELGGHMIDIVIAALGRPTAVRPWIRHDTSEADTHNDNTLVVFEYPKALATIVSSAKDPAFDAHRSFEIIGTEGTISVQPMEPLPVLHVHVRSERGPYKAGVQELKLPRQPRFIRDFQELARAIQTGAPLAWSYDHELLLHETLLRASGDIS